MVAAALAMHNLTTTRLVLCGADTRDQDTREGFHLWLDEEICVEIMKLDGCLYAGRVAHVL
jgi:hypothetical protein